MDQQTHTNEQFQQLRTRLVELLEQKDGLCLDNDNERQQLADFLAASLLRPGEQIVSPEVLLPKARYHLSFNIVDEPTGEHIVRVTLARDRLMTDGDFLQMQNFFWCTIGRAIRDNPEVVRVLRAGGIDVTTLPSGGGEQAAL